MTSSALTPTGHRGHDDTATVCAISILAAMLADILHEGVGHAAVALLTGAQSGVLSTVAWSSEFDSRLVAAGGTFVNLVAAGVLWLLLRNSRNAEARFRLFLLLGCAFNLFDGTGYFFFSGVTDFGDWAKVIQGMDPHWLWRALLVLVGIAAYYGAVLVVGRGFTRELGTSVDDGHRLRKLALVAYGSAIAIVGVSGLFNPLGMQLVWQSALPATAGAYSGLLWFQHTVPHEKTPDRVAGAIGRSYAWMLIAIALSLGFVIVLGRGVTLSW